MSPPFVEKEALIAIGAVLSFVFACLYYLRFSRSKLIANEFKNKFDHEVTLLSAIQLRKKEFQLQDLGSIYIYLRPKDNTSVFLFRGFNVVPSRFVYYLGIELEGWNESQIVEPGVYGSGYLERCYSDPYGRNKISHTLSELTLKPNIPEGYSIIEFTETSAYAFYEMPEFFGYGPIDKIKEWVDCFND